MVDSKKENMNGKVEQNGRERTGYSFLRAKALSGVLAVGLLGGCTGPVIECRPGSTKDIRTLSVVAGEPVKVGGSTFMIDASGRLVTTALDGRSTIIPGSDNSVTISKTTQRFAPPSEVYTVTLKSEVSSDGTTQFFLEIVSSCP